MERWSSSLIYPVTAFALGVVAAFAFAAVAAPIWASFAIGLSTAVGALALRNWWLGEEERPLLAEELMGLHDAVDMLRAENQELRDLMSEAVEIAEYRISEDAGAPAAAIGRAGGALDPQILAQERAEEAVRVARAEALLKEARRANAAQEAQIGQLEARIAALEASLKQAAAPSETPYLDRFEARLDAQEDRTQKMLHALSLAIDATRRHSDALRRMTEDAAQAPVDPSDAAPQAASPKASDAALEQAAAIEAAQEEAQEETAPVDQLAALARPEPESAALLSSDAGAAPEADESETPLERMRRFAGLAASSKPAEAPSPAADPEPRRARTARIAQPNIETLRAETPKIDKLQTGEVRNEEPRSALRSPQLAPAAALRVQPIFRAETRRLQLLELLPDGETEADLAAGALLDRALGLASGFRRQERKLAALFSIGLPALRTEATLAPLLAQLRADPAIAPLLTPSISQAELAHLSDQDFALMRRLSDAGVRFALRNVDCATLAPERAAEAGVRYILLEAADIAAREAREPGALSRLALRLAQRGVSLVLVGVDDAERKALAAREPGVLAQGDAFAPPKRVSFS